MITTGIWCDECRRKYVMHRCKGRRLPCGHSYETAIGVWCQAFGQTASEHVVIDWRNGGKPCLEDVWILQADRPRRDFIGDDAWEFWGMRVQRDLDCDHEWWVGEWLASKPDALVRAFLNRWDSYKWAPDWIAFRHHPEARRACALMLVQRPGPMPDRSIQAPACEYKQDF